MKKVIIVGAGAAGLAAAHTLRKRDGIDVTLLEASDSPGGRMAGEEFDGFSISTGAQFFSENFDVALAMCDQLGVPIHPVSTATLETGFYRKGAVRIVNAMNLLTGKLLSPRSMWQLIKLVRLLRRRKEDFAAKDYARLLDLDTLDSLADYLKKLGCDELLADWVEPLFRGTMLCGTERIGMLFGLIKLWDATSTRFTRFCNPRRGVGAFSTALGRACADATLLATPAELVALEGSEKRVAGVFATGAFMKADAVICATTATATLQLVPNLPDRIRNALKKVTYSSCCHIVFGVDGHPLDRGRQRHACSFFPGSADRLLATHTDNTALSPSAAPSGKSIIHTVAAEEHSDELFSLGDDEIKRRAIEEVRSFSPAMPQEPLFTRVYRWKEAVYLASGGVTTEMQALRQQGLPGVKGLFLAGEYMDIPGVNGALRSGVNAAEDVVGFLSRNRPTREV